MKNLKIIPAKWDASAALFLESTCNDLYTINDLAFDVQSGACSLFNIHEGGSHTASMVLRMDELSGKKELVVVALGGAIKSGDLIQTLVSFWDGLAAKNKAGTIRAHVSKKGMAKLMERAGGILSEYVYVRQAGGVNGR